MKKKRSLRQRQLNIAILLGSLFIVALIGIFWVNSLSDEEYIPGEKITGLTSDLGRILPSDYPKVFFTEVSKEAGIDFSHFNGIRTIQLPEDMGSGAAWGDFDNDGWMDLYVVNFRGPVSGIPDNSSGSTSRSALYHNNGDGTFKNVSEISQLNLSI